MPTDPDAPLEAAEGPQAPAEEASELDDAVPEKHSDADAPLISEFSGLVQAPQFLMSAFRQMSADRVYVSRDAMLLKTQDTVGVNHVLRNQSLALAYLGVADPLPFCQPSRQVGGVVNEQNELFAQTMEIHLSRSASLMDLARRTEGACQDASTNGFAILKVTLQADYMKDPLGRARFGDMQEQVAEYQRLKERKAAGMIPADSAEDRSLVSMEQTIRMFVAGLIEEQIKAVPVMVPQQQLARDPVTGTPILDHLGQPMTQTVMVQDPTDPREMRRKAIIDGQEEDILGAPEVEHFLGFTCDQILPEDFRWDWNITRPEDMGFAEWQAHRSYMHASSISSKWGVTSDELKTVGGQATNPGVKARGGTATNATTQDPSLRLDIETPVVNDLIAVWELWHRRLGRRFVFIEGMSRFLENEVPQAVGSRFFPFFPIYYNRVSGQAVPVSDVQLVRNLQDEYNMMRTHDREARRSAYPVLFIQKGLLDKKARELYRNRLPFSVIEIDNAEEVKAQFTESTALPYNPQVFDTSKVQGDMEAMFGLPRAVTGAGSGEDLASALALAKEGMETGVSRRRVMVNRVLTDIFKWMAEISIKAFAPSFIQRTCGVLAVWPRLTTDELYTNLSIEVKGGLQGQPRAKDKIDLWQNFATIAQTLQLPVNGTEVLRELLDALNVRVDFKRFLAPVPIGAPPGMMPGAPMGPPGQAPAPSKGQGPDGGAPLMVDRGAPSRLDQIPNHPPMPTSA